MASRRAGRTGDARRRLELRVAPTHPHRWRAAPETTRRTAGPSRPRRTATDMTETAPVVTPPTSIINAVRTPTLLSRASTAAPAVSAFPAAEPLVPIRFESASLSRASHRNSGSLHPRISRATTASANPNQFIRRVPETMDMDLVDDLELLDDYDDLEFDRFGVAAGDTSRQECKQVDKKGTFYDFCFNTRLARSTVVHFQLRDLVWATSKHDVYMAQNYSVMHWSSLLQKGEEVLNAIDNVFPKQKVQGARPLFRMQTCSMAVRDNFMVAGGFRGELVCKYVDQPGVAFCTSVAEDDDNITNTVDLYESPNGSTRVIAGNNDCVVRVFDTERFRLLSHFAFPWSVNDTSVSPDGKLVAVLGDSSDCLIADLQSGKEIASLKGHLDYSFSSAWHPDGRVLATGNQDTTCRLWDVRNLSRSLAVLRGRIGAVRGLRFSSDGRFLAAAEAADFVHVYDARAGYSREQEIDIFGEVAGVSFSPDAEALFVGVADRTYGSLIEFRRRHRYEYLDSYL
ncbi:hypothetical protein PAHAL_2G453100 [Panicum hallii]|uniref:Uncharacterized protein n=1 Tax=Panicum hallii TaxID=206008 RepID=A0A2S3H4F6_9POAL|nr:hypothetical protein PAHAL_2G453100 [Panicum hallii]